MAAKYSFLRLIFRLTVLIFLIKSINSSDDYVKYLSKKCLKSHRPFFCVTYRISKFIQNFDFQLPENSAVKIVKIEPQYTIINDVLSVPRFISTDTEWDKFIKFLQRKLISFLSNHGIAFEVPSGVKVLEGRSLNDIDSNLDEKSDDLDQPRGHKMKEKKIFILSILIIAKLIKILLLVNMIFYVLLFIKKIILVTAIVFPSVLSHIKQACHQHHQQHSNTIIAEEASAHPTSWFGWRQDGPEKRYW